MTAPWAPVASAGTTVSVLTTTTTELFLLVGITAVVERDLLVLVLVKVKGVREAEDGLGGTVETRTLEVLMVVCRPRPAGELVV